MDAEVGRSGDAMAPADAGAPKAGDLVTAVVTGDTPDEAVEAAIASLHDYERAGFELIDYAWRPQAGLPASTADMTFRVTRTWATPPGPRTVQRPPRDNRAREAKYFTIGFTILLLALVVGLFAFRLWSDAEELRRICESVPDITVCDQ